jgi:two-component system, LytTR family, response regulator
MIPGMTFTAMVVDDEPLARKNLTALLRRDPQVSKIDECGSGARAIQEIQKTPPDLLFLDVQMPECDGFDVLEQLGSAMPSAVVFVTAHDVYALRAFDAGALDYLLKPFDDARFIKALERAKEKINHSQPRDQRPVERLVVKNAGQVLFLSVGEIDWIEAADYYACLHVGSHTHLLRRTLSDLERELQATEFCRIHRSVLVNLKRVRGLELRSDGEYEVLLTSGERLRMSRRFRKQLQARLSAGIHSAGLIASRAS